MHELDFLKKKTSVGEDLPVSTSSNETRNADSRGISHQFKPPRPLTKQWVVKSVVSFHPNDDTR